MIINGYRIIGELRTAGSGYARWGFARKDGIDVFIKEFLSPVYPPDDAEMSKENMDKKRKICFDFEREKRTLYREIDKCRTGNIIPILDFFRHGSKYYVVTEKIDAETTDAHDICAFTDYQKILLVKIILDCIGSLHRNGVVHGDIKPDNILVKKTAKGSYTAKIIDFDSSFLEYNSPDNHTDVQGDPVYMAPETFLFMAEEDVKLTSKVDVFALGLLFHLYYCGRLPAFNTERYDYAFEAVLNGEILGIDPGIPDDMGQIIGSMLRRDPDKRPGLDEIFRFLTIDSVTKERFSVAEENTAEDRGLLVSKLKFSKNMR